MPSNAQPGLAFPARTASSRPIVRANAARRRSSYRNFTICGRARLTLSWVAGRKTGVLAWSESLCRFGRVLLGAGSAGRSEDCEVEEGLFAGKGRGREKDRVPAGLRGCIHGSEHSSDPSLSVSRDLIYRVGPCEDGLALSERANAGLVGSSPVVLWICWSASSRARGVWQACTPFSRSR